MYVLRGKGGVGKRKSVLNTYLTNLLILYVMKIVTASVMVEITENM